MNNKNKQFHIVVGAKTQFVRTGFSPLTIAGMGFALKDPTFSQKNSVRGFYKQIQII